MSSEPTFGSQKGCNQQSKELPSERPEHSGEYRCPECGMKVTKGPSGIEYGHSRRNNHPGRCSRRPESVDPGGPEPFQELRNDDGSLEDEYLDKFDQLQGGRR